MIKKTFSLLVAMAATILSQVNGFDWLNPGSFPQAMSCDTTGHIRNYKDRIQGLVTYKVRATPPVPGTNPIQYASPVIDGQLEGKIWAFSDTIVMNSWNDAGSENACRSKNFFGPLDNHAVWRVMYNKEALFVGVEVFDNIHDVDSLKSWSLQDGIEVSIDPWDWGEADTWKQEPLVPLLRRYWNPSGTLASYPGNAQNCFVHLVKRMNSEPYLAGLIRGVQKRYYIKGDEVNNHTRGTPGCAGIDFAASKQGVDPWGRMVWHLEFKFPYHGPLWAELEGKGFYRTDGLPRTGNLFKMNFAVNDDDILGADGSVPNVHQLTRRHYEAPWWQTHWSDTRFFMVMEYANPTDSRIGPYPYTVLSDKPHNGDTRIAGVWVNRDSLSNGTRYEFKGNGFECAMGNCFYFDSVGQNFGTILNLFGEVVSTYVILCPKKSVWNGGEWVSVPTVEELRIGQWLVLVRDGRSAAEVALGDHGPHLDCRPNPFNVSTTFALALPPGRPGTAYSLELFDSRGREIRTLAQGRADAGGLVHRVSWDGRDNLNRRLSAGAYIWRLSVGKESRWGKLIILE